MITAFIVIVAILDGWIMHRAHYWRSRCQKMLGENLRIASRLVIAEAKLKDAEIHLTHAPCNPADACATHGRCWTHSTWADEVEP